MKRQIIIDDLDAKLKAISIANGYLTNAGANVFAWRNEPLQENELPGITYKDKIVSIELNGPIGYFRWGLNVEISGYTSATNNTPAEARKLLADIIKAIGVCHAGNWAGQASTTEIVNVIEMTIEKANIEAGVVVITVNIVYDAPRWEI